MIKDQAPLVLQPLEKYKKGATSSREVTYTKIVYTHKLNSLLLNPNNNGRPSSETSPPLQEDCCR